jgi:5-methylcytosine-specific restriction enzyme subunit McrC
MKIVSKSFVEYEVASFDEVGGVEIIDKLEIITKDLQPPFFTYYGKNTIRFTSQVGLVQVGDIQIEVLPKVFKEEKKLNDTQENNSRNFLLDILSKAGYFEKVNFIKDVNITKQNKVHDFIFAQYHFELNKLLQKGLIKRYRKQDGNLNALKGKLLFNENIKHNFIHQERFYTRHTVYDHEHAANQVLLGALKIIPNYTHNNSLKGEAKRLNWQFPEIDSPNNLIPLFNKIKTDRKLDPYKSALKFAEMIIRSLHPSLQSGTAPAFALLFNMNEVYELYVKETLRKQNGVKYVNSDKGVFIEWKNLDNSFQRTDMVVTLENDNRVIIDTKWKLLNEKPSEADVRQIFAYCHQFKAQLGILLYPLEISDLSQRVTFECNTTSGNAQLPLALACIPVFKYVENKPHLSDDWAINLLTEINSLNPHSLSLHSI